VDIARAIRDVHRPAAPAPVIRACLVVLDRLEQRQQIVEAPAGISGIAPFVEVFALTPHPDHRVDRARPAEQLAARPVVSVAGQPRVGLGPVVPVHLWIVKGLAVAERHLNEEAPVGSAGFQHKHGKAPACRKAFGQGRAGRSGADDNEIIGLHWLLPPTVRFRSPKHPAHCSSPMLPACAVKNATAGMGQVGAR
jgi:hypothetical protein